MNYSMFLMIASVLTSIQGQSAMADDALRAGAWSCLGGEVKKASLAKGPVYSIDWGAPEQGEDAVLVEVDVQERSVLRTVKQLMHVQDSGSAHGLLFVDLSGEQEVAQIFLDQRRAQLSSGRVYLKKKSFPIFCQKR